LNDPIRRKIGYFLSERDQFVLKTLFYPIRLHFGYLSKENKNFRKDLDEIRKSLSEPFDFEKRINAELALGKIDFKRNASSIFFRNVLQQRWETLKCLTPYEKNLGSVYQNTRGLRGPQCSTNNFRKSLCVERHASTQT